MRARFRAPRIADSDGVTVVDNTCDRDGVTVVANTGDRDGVAVRTVFASQFVVDASLTKIDDIARFKNIAGNVNAIRRVRT